MNCIDFLTYLVKNWSPAIVGIAALYYSNKNVASQIENSNKNVSLSTRKDLAAKWVDDFRKEVTEYLANLMVYYYTQSGDPNKERERHFSINKSSFAIEIFLNRKNEQHEKLYAYLLEMNTGINTDTLKRDSEFIDLMDNIKAAAKEIIEAEQAKI
ncbi:MAG: hypothetical protein V4439_04460 [Patescibacteria group bacterium]